MGWDGMEWDGIGWSPWYSVTYIVLIVIMCKGKMIASRNLCSELGGEMGNALCSNNPDNILPCLW